MKSSICKMLVPNSVKNASKLLIFILGVVKCIDIPIIRPPIFNLNPSTIPENLDEDNCPPPQPIEHGNIEIKDYMGQTAAFITCDKNFTLIGKTFILTDCVDGVWKFSFGEALPKCERRCPPPPILEHGTVDLEKKLEDVYLPTGSYLEGTVATYTCNEGYLLKPSSSVFRICEKGLWTGVDAFCKPAREINCPRPSMINNGYMQPSFPLEFAPILIGQEVQYQCLRGYKLRGSDKSKCTEHGVWVPDPPSCYKENELIVDFCYLAM